MKFNQLLKDIAASAGFHVVRNYQNPEHTAMGLLSRRFATVFDVGANSGQFARWMLKRLPQAEMFCFEPTPHAFAELQAWAASRPRVHAVQLALGERTEQLEMFVHREHTPSSSLLATSSHCQQLYPFTADQDRTTVQVLPLDDYLAALDQLPTAPWFLKIDVQGYETPVLRGATQTLRRVDACIIEVSLDELYLGQSRFCDIVALTAATGLHYAGNFQQVYSGDGRVIYLDAVFVRPSSHVGAATANGGGNR